MKMRWKPVLFSLPIIFLLSCQQTPKKIMFGGETQGTYYAVTYFDKAGRNLQRQVDSILHAFDLTASMWIPGSIISKINNDDTSVAPDNWFQDLFNMSMEVSRATDGAFDFTVGPLVNAWGFGFKGTMEMNQDKVDSLLQYVGYQKVRLLDNGRIDKIPGVKFDFNAIAQGYAVDLLGKYFEDEGIHDYLVDIGGEVLGRGQKPDGSPWLVGIENPTADSLSERTINTKIRLTDMAVSTSGSYRKYRVDNGIRYSHTIDPMTGYPVRHSVLSVSVLARDCATADAYATAFMVMGVEKARTFMEKNPGLEAYFIISGENGIYSTYATDGFEKIIVKEE